MPRKGEGVREMQGSNESRCNRGMRRARCADRPSRHCVYYANACVCNHRKTHYLDFPRDALVSGASEGRHGSRIAMQRVSWQRPTRRVGSSRQSWESCELARRLREIGNEEFWFLSMTQSSERLTSSFIHLRALILKSL